MPRKLIPLLIACAFGCLMPSTALAKHRKHAHPYYLALGDSLARGAQPFGPVQSSGLDQTIATNQGYANDLYAAEKHKIKGLRLEQLGCLGETTGTMIKGGICHYASGSQLAQAIKFIHKHKIAFITLDIGANDVDGCATATGVDIACVEKGLASIQADVPTIVSKLRKAAGRRAKIAAMTYYDPFLADWFSGSSGLVIASLSQSLAKTVNGDLASAYQAKHFRVADVATAFDTYGSLGTTPYPYAAEPAPIANLCKWTWMCAPAPRGPNIHANAAGYSEIATVFRKTLR